MKTSKGIFYEVIGEGKPIIFLHGMGLNRTSLFNIANSLENKCVLVDLRNHGDSGEFKKILIEDLMKDIDEIIELENLEKPSFVGHSLGSFLALNCAERNTYGLDKLFLINEVHKISFRNLRKSFLLFGLLSFKIVSLFIQKGKNVDFSKLKDLSVIKMIYWRISSQRVGVNKEFVPMMK